MVDDKAKLRRRVEEIAQSAMRESPIVGMSIGVSFRGETIFAESYGSADIGERSRPRRKRFTISIRSPRTLRRRR